MEQETLSIYQHKQLFKRFQQVEFTQHYTNDHNDILHIKTNNLSAVQMNYFVHTFKNIKSLNYQQIYRDQNLSLIPELKNLQKLNIQCINIVQYLPPILQIKNLKSICLKSREMTSQYLQMIANQLPLLQQLYFRFSSLISPQQFSVLQKFKSLKSFGMQYLKTVQKIPIALLQNLKNIQILEFDKILLQNLNTLSPLKQMPNLKKLTLIQFDVLNRNNKTIYELLPLQLQSLTLTGDYIQYNINLNTLFVNCPKLKQLCIRGCDFGYQSMNTISEKGLFLESFQSYCNPKIQYFSWQKLIISHPQLLKLNINQNDAINNKLMLLICNIKTLQQLKLIFNSLTNHGITNIRKLKQLKTLNISNNICTDPVFQNILKNLKKLKIAIFNDKYFNPTISKYFLENSNNITRAWTS